MSRYFLFLLFLFFFSHSASHADDQENRYSTPMDAVYPQSPQAAALARYGEYPVGHTTGVPDITIPLYEVKVGDYTLPVSISYHASGIKVSDVASTVGLGWSLNAGGVITRNVCGAPDLEYASRKYYDYDEVRALVQSVKMKDTYIADLNHLLEGGGGDVMQRLLDCASDRYIFNFSTRNGVLRYSYKENEYIAVNHSNMKFYVLENAGKCYFYVVDADGTEYYFKQQEYTGIPNDENNTGISSWYLTEINTKNGSISFNYRQSAEYHIVQSSETLTAGDFCMYDSSDIYGNMYFRHEPLRYHRNCERYLIRTPVLASIEWDGHIMEFHYANDREDLWKTRLYRIEVRNSNGDIFKTVDFDNHSFWGGKSEEKRMMLRGIDVSDEGLYKFRYNDNGESLPAYQIYGGTGNIFGLAACHEDYWGYYNGKTAKTHIPKEAYSMAFSKIYGDQVPYYPLSSFADRNPDEHYLKYGIIKQITYPTSGYTTFDFEWNGMNHAGLRIKSVSNYDTDGKLLGRKSYTYTYAMDVADHPLETMAYPTYHITNFMPFFPFMQEYEDMTCVGAPEFPISCSGSVFYTDVCETYGNGDRTEYSYSCVPEPGIFCGRVSLGEPPHLTYGSLHDYGIVEPYLIKKTCKNPVGETLMEETYDYETSEVRKFSAGVRIASFAGYTEITDNKDRNLYWKVEDPRMLFKEGSLVFDSITVHSTVCRLLKKTVRNFATGLTKSETYTYDSGFRTAKPKTVRTVNSDGREYVRENIYTFDSDDPVHQKMAVWYNMLDMLACTKEYCDGTLLCSEKTDYVLHNDWFYPERISRSVLSGPYYEMYRFLDYNEKGNFRKLITNRCDTSTVDWGYGGIYPVSIRLNGGAGTGYTWKPLYGVSSITEKNGYTEYYDYISGGRLTSVSDASGIKQQIYYNYRNSSGSQEYNNHVKTITGLTAAGDNTITAYQYYDGLGRPTLAGTTGIGSSGKYVYTLQEYDLKGRTACTWLPSVGDSAGGEPDSTELVSLSQSTYGDSHAFSRTEYDAIDRPLSSSTAGEPWYSQGKGKACNYVTNDTLSVVLYQAPLGANTLVKAGYYRPKTLEGEETVDEDGHSLIVFKDKLGRKVLERRNGDNDTYFVYNDLGQLRYVLSPQYQFSGIKAALGYEYRYDSRGNIVKKILPGCEYIQYWYDGNDRLTFMQDAMLREQGKYRFMLYDRQNRLAVQGICSACDRGFKEEWEFPSVTFMAGTGGFLSSGYDFPQEGMITGGELELVNYYDGYAFLSAPAGGKFPASFSPSGACVTGLLTGTSMRTSEGGFVHSVMAYDSKGRLTETVTATIDGMEEKEAVSYTFTDNVSHLSYELKKGGTSIFSAETNTAYNRHNDKAETVSLSVRQGSGTAESRDVASYLYDDLGRISAVIRPGGAGSITYGYNLHGWVTSVRSNSFEENIFYADNGRIGIPCYNGNISLIKWKNRDYQRIQGYKFTYDGLNRLVFAEYGENESVFTNPNRYDEKVLEYDRNGNILRFQRRGLKQNGVYGKTDNLHLSFEGNRLTGVRDDAAKLLYAGAVDFNGDSRGYATLCYDKSGSLTSDTGRGISLIDYDIWGNPRRIQFSDGNVTEYVYTAAGVKLRTVHYTAMPNITVDTGTRHDLTDDEILYKDSTDYHGSLVMENGHPSMYLFDGGYCSLWDNVSKAAETSFHYYTKDHLGNTREVMDGSGTLEQVTNYYPFGTPYSDHTATGVALQKYKYNGKEFDLTHGLNTYDYGARQYYSVLLRWDRMDRLCESYYHVSPYVYCLNNLVNAIDPDGRGVLSRVLKVVVKVGGRVARNGVKALGEAATYVDAVSDITDNVRTLFDSNASTGERVWAGVSLASEALPVSIGDAKSVAKRARQITPNEGKARPHGGKAHNERIDKMIGRIKKGKGVSGVRKNQAQVDYNGNKVGNNRPDIQFDKDGVHTNIEYDTKQSSLEHHRETVTKNDPEARNKFYKIENDKE